MSTSPSHTEPPLPMALALSASFGSVESWRRQFLQLADSSRGAAGQVELVFAPSQGQLVNRWVSGVAMSDPNSQVLALQMPAEASAFLASLDWAPVYQRYQDVVHAASGPWGTAPAEAGEVQRVDVRRDAVFNAAPTMLPAASWRDPARVSEWAHELSPDQAVLVYCVYGHEVGRATALRLRALGVNARYLSGGIDAWQRAGLPLVAKQLMP